MEVDKSLGLGVSVLNLTPVFALWSLVLAQERWAGRKKDGELQHLRVGCL